MLAAVGLPLSLPHSYKLHEIEALLESTESLIDASLERADLAYYVSGNHCPGNGDKLGSLTSVIDKAFHTDEDTEGVSAGVWAASNDLTTEQMQAWMRGCMKTAWAEAGLDSNWFKAKVNYVFKPSGRDVDKMYQAGQLRSQFLCISTLPWATWKYHPSLGYSDCVFDNEGDGVTQAIIYVPPSYWSDCTAAETTIPTSTTVDENIIKCNVKAEGSVTLLSDLDFQVRCCQGLYKKDDDFDFPGGPLLDKSCNPRAYTGKTYESSSAEICIAKKLTLDSMVPVGNFQAPPGVSLDTNWYPGDFANVGAYDGLSCGKDAVAPARVAVSLFALLNGVAVAAKDFDIPSSGMSGGADTLFNELFDGLGASGKSLHDLRLQALANVKKYLKDAVAPSSGLSSAATGALAIADKVFGEKVDEFDQLNKARADAESANPDNYKKVCQSADRRDVLFFDAMQTSTTKLYQSSHTVRDGAVFCEEIMINLIYANEAYLVKGALKGLKLKLDNQLEPLEMLENLAQNLGMGLEHTAEETHEGDHIKNKYKVGDGIIKYGKYFDRALGWTQKTGTVKVGGVTKTISNAKEGPDGCGPMDGDDMIKRAKGIFPGFPIENEMEDLRELAMELMKMKKAAGHEEEKVNGQKDALVDMAYGPGFQKVTESSVVNDASSAKLGAFIQRVLKLTMVLTAAMLEHIFTCPSLA